jgi:hypothetical protein
MFAGSLGLHRQLSGLQNNSDATRWTHRPGNVIPLCSYDTALSRLPVLITLMYNASLSPPSSLYDAAGYCMQHC